MSKLALYLERVSQEDAELEQEEVVEQTPEEIAVQEGLVENEIEVPEVDEEITPEVVAETEEESEEASEEMATVADDIEEADDIEAEVEDEVESLEEYQGILQHGLRTKTYSPQFAAAVQLKLNKMGGVFSSEVPALENFDGQDLEQYYTVSLETFQGFVKRLNDAVQSVSRNMVKKQREVAGTGADNYVGQLHKRADLVIKSPAAAEPKVLKAKSISSNFALGGKPNSDIYKALVNDFKQGSGLLKQAIPESIKYYNALVDIIERAVKEGGAGKTGSIVAEAVKLKLPADLIPAGMFTDGLAGDIILAKSKESGAESVRDKLKSIGDSAIPAFAKGITKGEAGEVTIDKATADKVAKQAKANAALAQNILANHIKPLTDSLDKRLDVVTRAAKGANASSWSENKDLNLLSKQLRPVLNRLNELLWNVTHGLLTNAENALNVVEGAVSVAKVTETEDKKD